MPQTQTETQYSEETQEKSGSIKKYTPLAVIILAAGLVYAMGWHKYLSIQSLAENKEWLTQFVAENFLLAIFLYALTYILVVALSLPVATFLSLFGAILFGALLGGSITVIAATIGALIIFYIAKTSLGDSMAKQAGPWLEKLRSGFREHALNYLLFLRLVPVFPFWLVNIAPALLGVKASTYTIGTFLGIIPGTMAYAFVGAGLGSVIDAQKQSYDTCLASKSGNGEGCSFSFDASSILTPQLLLAFVALGVVALIPVVMNKFRNSKT